MLPGNPVAAVTFNKERPRGKVLMDHAVPGIEGFYVHERALLDRLLVAQERMTAAVFDLCGVDDGRAPAVRKA
jgi:hypothetical protein